MSVPQFIDGVIVHREATYGPNGPIHSANNRTKSKAKYHRYAFPHSALRPGAHSPCISMLFRLLGLRILYIHFPLPFEIDNHLNLCSSSLLGYWPSTNWLDPARARHIVLYRDDLRPLHPKQVEALWEFCDRLAVAVTPGVILENQGSKLMGTIKWVIVDAGDSVDPKAQNQFEELADLVMVIWGEHFTVNNFSAFFELYRAGKLLKGDEGWRDVESLLAN